MRFQVQDPDSGQTVTLEGDSPPTEQELEQVFSTFSKPKADIFRGPTDFEKSIVQAGSELPPEIPRTGRFDLSQNPIQPAPTLTQEASQFGQDVTSTLGNVARAIPADVAAGLSLLKRPENQPQTLFPSPTAIAGAISQNMPYAIETAGNIPAALAGEPLPIDKTLSEAATESVPAATVGKISQGIAATAPMAIIGVLPAAAQKAALLAFTAKMISDAPEVATQLGTELGKPKDEQDPDKISGLVSDAIQITGFSVLGGTHLAKSGFDFIKKPSTTGEVLWSSSTPESGKANYFSNTKSDADAYSIGRESKQYKVKSENPFDVSTSTDKELLRLYDELGGLYEAPQNPRFIAALKSKGYDSVVGSETGAGGESKWVVTFDKNKSQQTGEVYATQKGVIPESRVSEYQRASEVGTPTETGGGNRPIGSPPSEALPPLKSQEIIYSPKVSVSDLSKQKAIGAYSPATGELVLDRESLKNLPKEKRDELVRHEIAHKVETESELWKQSDDYLWKLWESNPNHPLFDWWTERGNKREFNNDVSPEMVATLYAENFEGGTFKHFDPRLGEYVETDIPRPLWEVLKKIDEKTNIYAKRDLRQTSKALPPQQPQAIIPSSTQVHPEAPGQTMAPKVGEPAAPAITQPGPGIVGLGGATPSELVPGTGQDIYSIAQAGREARASSGQVAPVKPGEGTTLPDSIEHGRELLGQDATAADKAISRFESDPEKAVSANGIAVTRAKGEELSLAARRIEEKFGTDSPEYRLAWKALSDWDARTKPMQTEWQKMGVAQQGATDIDTGSITGLQRAYKENTGQDFNPPQMKKAAKIVAGVKKADVIVETAKPVLQSAIDAIPEKVKTPDDIPGQKNTFAGYESGKPMTDEQVKVIWKRAKSYIDAGMDDKPAIIFKVASDLGIESKDVLRGMSKTRQVKRVADDVWQKQRQARILKDLAKRWVYKANETWASKIIPVTARSAFAAKTGLHGTVAMGTHAPLVVATHPKIFAENFGKMYKLVASPEYYQMQQYELSRRPNYNVAQRAGLVNDMSKMEDFSDPNITQGFPKIAAFFKSKLDKAHLGRLVGMGTRGYSVLKVLRQDLFDHEWNKLADGDKSPDMAKAIADTVNHITGVVKAGAPTGAHYALFAPKLLLSRLAVVGRDPAIAANSLLKMENMSPSEKWFLKNQVKEKAKIFAVASGLLAANQALNNFLGDKKKLNGVPESLGGGGWDPMKSDFMKFRIAGMNFAWGSPFLTMMRLPLRIIRIGMGDGGKSKNLIYPDESMAYEAFKYARTQESPFLNPIVSLITKADYAGRPLPQIPGYGPPPPVPKRLAAQGVKPYTWPEFIAETVLPIPFQEGAKEIFHYASSGDADKEKALMKGFLTTLIMGATGGRVGEDWEKPQTPVRRALVQQ